MKDFCVGKYIIRLMNKNDIEEVRLVQKLRYDYLLKDYNPLLTSDGYDDDGYDEYADSILVINSENNDICGVYRVATLETNPINKFMMESEFDLTPLKEKKESFMELSRAVVNPKYRDGITIQLLFLGIYHYATEHNCKYILGLCSFHGTDPSIYKAGMAYVQKNYSFEKYQLKAVMNPFRLDIVETENIDKAIIREQTPGLLRMYLNLGCKIGCGGSIDMEFKSLDVLIVFDIDEVNKRYLDRLIKMENN